MSVPLVDHGQEDYAPSTGGGFAGDQTALLGRRFCEDLPDNPESATTLRRTDQVLSDRLRDSFTQFPNLLAKPFSLVCQAIEGGGKILFAAGPLPTEGGEDSVAPACIFDAATAEEESKAYLATNLLGSEEAHEPELGRVSNVGSTARILVNTLDNDQSESIEPFRELTQPWVDPIDLGSGYISVMDRHRVLDDPLNSLLGDRQVFRCNPRRVEIDRRLPSSQMKRLGAPPKTFLQDRREEMLTGMLLHVVVSTIPIDFPLDSTLGNRTLQGVDERTVSNDHVDNSMTSQNAPIVRLTP